MTPKTPCIPVEECVDGGLYRIWSRNLQFGVYRAEVRGFIGIREKFGSLYLFTEYHWDNGPPFGTVRPKELLEQCPVTPINEGESVEVEGQKVFRQNKALFDWLTEKEKQWQRKE